MTRLVLLSDASKEFPTSTSSCFTVRLSEPLQLEEEGIWEVGLLSLSMSDAGLRLDKLTATDTSHLVWVSFLVDVTVQFTVDDLTKMFSITDGEGLMKSIMGLLEWMQTETVQMSATQYVRDAHRPTFHWEGDDLVLVTPRT